MVYKDKIMKINKKAALGEGVLMIYRLLLVTIIAIVILGISAIYYDYYIDVKNAESVIMAKDVVNCLAPEGVLDLAIVQGHENDFLDKICGISNLERFYVGVNISSAENQLVFLKQGDNAAIWAKEIYKKSSLTGKIGKYEPGQFSWNYTINLLKDGQYTKSKMNVEVLVSYEF